ncbi:MAG: HAD family hydrolase [Candidatus Asgardarchaeia archaeon]
MLKACLLDLYGTLAYVENAVSDETACKYLQNRGYEVYPQEFKAAWQFVSFIDYPKYGYNDWESYLRQVLWRLDVKVDDKTLKGLAEMFMRSKFKLYPEVLEFLAEVKSIGLKTAIVTTIAKFKFANILEKISPYIDFVMTGYEARCEKSNPKMYKKTLEILRVKAKEAIMIGDDLKLDVILAKRVGMHAILLDRTGKVQSSEDADMVIHDLNEAIPFIKALL